MRPAMVRPLIAQARVELPRVDRAWRVLGVLLLVNALIAAVGLAMSPLFSADSAAWYSDLRKPVWAPFPAVIAVVWVLFYVPMAIAAWWLVRKRPLHASRRALNLYALQLLLNGLWLPLLFGLRQPGLAGLDLALLLLTLAFTMREVSRRHTAAAMLLVPYVVWAAFMFVVTFETWRLNA